MEFHRSGVSTQDSADGLVLEWPRWVGYAVTLFLEVALTLFLVWLYPYFPLGDYPIPYILLIMAVAYLFGEGPAILALVAGLFIFDYFFVPPAHTLLPIAINVEGWATTAAFFMGTSIVGFATIMMRRSSRRIHALAQDLERQTALLETFTHNVPVGLALHDRQTRHLIANEAIAKFNARALSEIIGKTVWEIAPEPAAAIAAAAIERVFATGEPSVQQGEMAIRGEDRYFDIAHYPVSTSDGEIVGVGAVVVETTEQMRARQALERDYDREHRIADILERSLLSNVDRRIGAFEFETLYRAALDEARVGGDFYDVFELSADKIAIVIGDVSGKGLRAAVQVAMARCNMRGRLYDCHDPSVAMQQVNNTLVHEMAGEAFVTMFVGILDTRSRTLTYSNAGHEPIILWSAQEQQARLLGSTGPLLGMLRDSAFTAEEVVLNSGDEVLLGTDGLYELKCDHGYMRIDELIDIYAEMKQTQDFSALKLVDEVIKFCGSDLRDDIAILRVGVVE